MSTPETLTRELAALDDALAGRPVDPDLADLAELALLVRDERPAPDPAFAHSLDERAQRGFPRAARRRMRAFSWPKLTLPALGVAASVLLVVVLVTSQQHGTTTDQSGSGGGDSAGSEAASSPATDEAAPADSRASAQSKAAPNPTSPAIRSPLPTDGARRRSVERSAQLTLATTPRNIDTAASKILQVTDDLGGYVVSSQVSSGSSGEFELRVPERRLQTALSRLSKIGKVRERTQSSQDITATVVSAASRLKDARTERRSLLKQLAKATTPNETTSIRERLRLVSGQIAVDKRELARVKGRASSSTIAVSLVADKDAGAAVADDGWSPGDALGDAARILEVSAGVLLVAGAIAVPFGLIALLVWLAARQAAHRRRERALDAV
jgi:Domain of unknown function (DUF4349)